MGGPGMIDRRDLEGGGKGELVVVREKKGQLQRLYVLYVVVL
jgi:hypothetical protein